MGATPRKCCSIEGRTYRPTLFLPAMDKDSDDLCIICRGQQRHSYRDVNVEEVSMITGTGYRYLMTFLLNRGKR